MSKWNVSQLICCPTILAMFCSGLLLVGLLLIAAYPCALHWIVCQYRLLKHPAPTSLNHQSPVNYPCWSSPLRGKHGAATNCSEGLPGVYLRAISQRLPLKGKKKDFLFIVHRYLVRPGRFYFTTENWWVHLDFCHKSWIKWGWGIVYFLSSYCSDLR